MAVNKKGMRQVRVRGKLYYWRVKESRLDIPDEGFVAPQEARRVLDIISSNKQFIVHYLLPQAGDAYAELRVEGPYFPLAPGAKRVAIPRWKHDSKRYPTADFVRRLIDYCVGE